MPRNPSPKPARRARVAGPERRAMIIDAARNVFGEHGFDGAATASIAAAAGCSEAVLYRHFPSKVALLIAVFDDEGRRLHQKVGELAAAFPDPLQRLSAMARHLHGTAEGWRAVRIVILAINAADQPGVEPALIASFGALRQTLSDILAEGQAVGSVRSDMTAGDLSWLWHSLLVTGGLRASVRDDDVAATLESAVATLAQLSRGQT